MNEYLVSIDAGTGSVRAVVFDTELRVVAAVGREWTHQEQPGVPGSMEFDHVANWATIESCIRDVLQRIPGGTVRAISATSMREGIVAFDASGHEVWAVANVDSRASRQVSRLRDAGLEPAVYRRSGQTFALAAQPRLAWLAEADPERFARVVTIAMLSDWVLARLSGVVHAEPSNASTSAMVALGDREWDPELSTIVGLPGDLGAPMVEPGTVIGTVRPDVAKRTGLSPKTPVVVGGGDAQLATLALGVVDDDEAVVIGGSFWQQEVNLRRPIVDPGMRIRVNCHALPDAWQAEAITFFPGLAVRWFRDVFYSDIVATARTQGVDPYDLITEEAALVPVGSHGIVPILSDAMHFERWEHAAPSFLDFGLDPQRFTRAAFFRSLMENAAIVTAANLDAIEQFAGVRPHSIVFSGGASRSPLWCGILADVLGRPVKVPAGTEASALGAAICGSVGAGIHRSLAEAATAVAVPTRTHDPDPTNRDAYVAAADKWRSAYAAQLELSRAGITTPMWKAPGV
jgi:autoinducer 2 (AI-2) kinase